MYREKTLDANTCKQLMILYMPVLALNTVIHKWISPFCRKEHQLLLFHTKFPSSKCAMRKNLVNVVLTTVCLEVAMPLRSPFPNADASQDPIVIWSMLTLRATRPTRPILLSTPNCASLPLHYILGNSFAIVTTTSLRAFRPRLCRLSWS